MRRRLTIAAAGVAATMAVAGCGGGGGGGGGDNGKAAAAAGPVVVRVQLSDFRITLSRTQVPAGKPVEFLISNAGAVEHEMVLEPGGSDDKPFEFPGVDGTKFSSEVEAIHPGATLAVTWRLPAAGSYQLACHVPGHFERGMRAEFKAT